MREKPNIKAAPHALTPEKTAELLGWLDGQIQLDKANGPEQTALTIHGRQGFVIIDEYANFAERRWEPRHG